jgi:hypothetical protein
MKLRIHANSVRLRLSDAEVACVASGEPIIEQTRFPGGVLTCRLELGGDEISAHFTAAGGIEIRLPEGQARGWAASDEVSLQRTVETDGATLQVLVERDLKRDRD